MDSDTPQNVVAGVPGWARRPDEMPRMLNTELPFRYPPALYARKVQGNVTLRLYIDRDGPGDARLDARRGVERIRRRSTPRR